MKKILVLLLAFAVLGSICITPTTASAPVDIAPTSHLISQTVEVLPDGSKTIISLYEDVLPIAPVATSYNTSGHKTYTGVNSSGETLWTFTLNGTFRVETGISATCFDASYSYTTPGAGWSLKTASATCSGNSAVGSATFVKKVLGITVETKDTSITLSCDANGNLS